MRVAVFVRDDMIDVFTAALNGGDIQFYDGTRPTALEAVSTQELLVTLTFGSPAFGASSSASATANAIASGTVVADGTPTWARLRTSGGAATADLTVGATGSGADIQFAGLGFTVDAEVTMSAFTVSMPIGS